MLANTFADFISLFFPRYCLSCKQQLIQQEEHICLSCRHDLPIANYNSLSENSVVHKLYGKAPVKFGGAYLKFVKSGSTQNLLHQLKYKNKPQIGTVLGKWYGEQLIDHLVEYQTDMIIPVPLHPKKKYNRGYNQSEAFGKGLAEALSINQNTTALVRAHYNTTQTNKSRIERMDNVENVFQVVDQQAIAGKNILLVDDMITTGATIASCANRLLDAGAKSVGVAFIAIADNV